MKQHQSPIRRITLLATVSFLSLGAVAQGALLEYTATLTGPAESPPNASPGTGSADVVYDTLAHTLHVHVDFSGLTSLATAAHIHAATATPLTGTAMVATTVPYFPGFPVGAFSGTYDNTFDLTLASSFNPAFITANGGTVASAEAALAAALSAEESYLNIHTSEFPGGEIRGFLTPVPEPSTILSGLLLTLPLSLQGIRWLRNRQAVSVRQAP